MAYIRVFHMMITTRQKGDIGEMAACKYLEKHGFSIVERNYLKKYGELDIVGTKGGIVHFFEVKSTTGVAGNSYRPEENVHDLKVRRLKRVIQAYLNERHHGLDAEFRFHILAVRKDPLRGKFHVRMIENVIL